jgi:hypothetical protein
MLSGTAQFISVVGGRFHHLEVSVINKKGLFFFAMTFLLLGRPTIACNQPPIPQSGQTVHWTKAKSPYEVCADATIPKGGTVVIDPGVTVHFQGHTIFVTGTMRAQGQPASRIALPADGVFPPTIQLQGGLLVVTFADFGGQLRPGPGKISVSDSSFTGTGQIFTLDILLPSLPPVISLTRCTFTNSAMQITDSYLVLTDSAFINSGASVLRGYLRLLGTNTLDGQPLRITREIIQSIQPLVVDGVHASNVATGGGLSLEGGSFLLGAKNVLQNNLYPVDIQAGLLPGSVVPPSGNTNELIWAHNGSTGAVARWANLNLPYLVDDFIDAGGMLTIDAGVKVLFDPTRTGFAGLTAARLNPHGLPTAPIIFDALNPSVPWDGLTYAEESYSNGSHLDYALVKNAKLGVVVSDGFLDITNSFFQSNQTAVNTNTFGVANISKSRLFKNQVGVFTTPKGAVRMNAPDLLPNWLQGNSIGVQATGPTIPAEHNYWGSPTGPQNPTNPGGQGDPVQGAVTFKPFETSPPNMQNNPPVVRMVPLGNSWYGIESIIRPPEYVVTPGERIILCWSVSNSTTVSRQRILLAPQSPDFEGTPAPIILADNIPADVRTFEITMPSIPFAPTNLPQFLRIVAIDSGGQQGWDQTPLIVPTGNVTGNIQITSDYSGKTFIGGHPRPPEMWTGNANGATTDGYIFLESDGGVYTTLPAQFPLPIVSTDTARQVVISSTNSNDLVWFFSPGYFSIRPDPALGLQPPVVHLTSPTSGQHFSGGSTVPITWTAAAQQGVRSFDIQYSANGGRTWHFITKDLASSLHSFSWELPQSAGIADARVRVIVRDKIFQNSSDGANVVFSIDP